MANLLAHSLFALALYSVVWSALTQEPLTEYGFLAGLVALFPDVDLGLRGARSPYGHSIGYALLWSLLSLSALGAASSLRLIPPSSVLPLQLAVVLGLWSHLLLDTVTAPGILGMPRGGRWSRLHLHIGRSHSARLDLLLSSVSTALLLTLVVLY